MLKWGKWLRNAPHVVFTQLWFYGGNAVCECFLPRLFPLHLCCIVTSSIDRKNPPLIRLAHNFLSNCFFRMTEQITRWFGVNRWCLYRFLNIPLWEQRKGWQPVSKIFIITMKPSACSDDNQSRHNEMYATGEFYQCIISHIWPILHFKEVLCLTKPHSVWVHLMEIISSVHLHTMPWIINTSAYSLGRFGLHCTKACLRKAF